MEKAVNVFEWVHPEAQGLFLFDNAPSHRKVPDDSLNADKMNVGPGGKQPIMRDTTWNGALQTMVRADGNENDPGGKTSGYKEHESRRHEKKIENLFRF